MPTARELLEQADALMRRNRQEAERAVRGPGLAPGPRAGSVHHPPRGPSDNPVKLFWALGGVELPRI